MHSIALESPTIEKSGISVCAHFVYIFHFSSQIYNVIKPCQYSKCGYYVPGDPWRSGDESEFIPGKLVRNLLVESGVSCVGDVPGGRRRIFKPDCVQLLTKHELTCVIQMVRKCIIIIVYMSNI